MINQSACHHRVNNAMRPDPTGEDDEKNKSLHQILKKKLLLRFFVVVVVAESKLCGFILPSRRNFFFSFSKSILLLISLLTRWLAGWLAGWVFGGWLPLPRLFISTLLLLLSLLLLLRRRRRWEVALASCAKA